MQELRSFALPTPPSEIHDYGYLQEHLFRSISARLLAFFILAMASLSGFLHPPTPMRLAPSPSSPPPSSLYLQIFFFFNSIALMSCVAGLLVSITHFLSAHQNRIDRYAPLGLQRKRLAEGLSKTAGGVACLVMVCVSLSAAYPFAGLTVAGECKSLQYAVVVPSLLGGLLLLEAILFLVRHFFHWWASFIPDHLLWRAIQQHTLFGSFLAKFL